MSDLTAYLNSDNVLTLSGLIDSITSSYQNTATVEVTLTDINGNEVTGETWPLTMNYVSASNGVYRATLVDTLSVSAGEYTATVTANIGAGQYRTFVVTVNFVDG